MSKTKELLFSSHTQVDPWAYLPLGHLGHAPFGPSSENVAN